ncbi:MAG: NAD(P)/FAD-dependent oxidoreductase [Myxococcota bacterium]
MDADVVVVGAGLSGLALAQRLEAAGMRVVVLEAGSRVGGRLWSDELGDGIVDRGGQWVGPMHTETLKLAARLGLKTFGTFHAGDKLQRLAPGTVERYSGFLPRLSAAQLMRLGRAIAKLEVDRRRVHPRRAGWDARSVHDALLERLPQGPSRSLLTAIVRSVFEAEPVELSWLHTLFHFDAHDGFIPLTSVRGGAQQDRFVGGAQQLPQRLAERVAARVVLSDPVTRIDQEAQGVRVRTAAAQYVARRVAICLPPLLTARIAYSPRLPETRTDLIRRLAMGRTIKFHLA